MNEIDTVQIVALVGWLILAAGALAGYRLSWKKGLVMAFAWGAIFLAVFLLFQALRGG